MSSRTEGAAGEVVSVTATPADGFDLTNILVDGKAIVGNTFTIKGNHTVTATFDKPITYTVSVGTVNNCGSIVLSATSGIYGDIVTVQPGARFQLTGVKVDGNPLTPNEDGIYSFSITGNHVVDATVTYLPTDGDVFFFPVKVPKGSVVEGYILTASEEVPAGTKMAVRIPSDATDATGWNNSLNRFWKMESGTLKKIVGAQNANTQNQFGYHDVIYALGNGTITIEDPNDGTHVARSPSCTLGFDAACGDESTTNRYYECPSVLNLPSDPLIIDLRARVTAGTTAKADTVAAIKALCDVGNAVINVYAPDCTTVSAIIVQDPATSFTPNSVVTVGEISNGTVTVSPAYGQFGTEVTITATPDSDYELENILLDGKVLDGNTFTISGDHVVTATFVKDDASLAVGDVIYVPGEILDADRVYTGVVVKSETMEIGSEVTVNLISQDVGEAYSREYYFGRFWTATANGFAFDTDVWQSPAGTLGVHDAFVSYDADANTMVIKNATNHEYYEVCAYRGGSETCGWQDRTSNGNECAKDGILELADDVFVYDARTLGEGETAVTDLAGLVALDEQGEVVMNIYCATPETASFIVILEVVPRCSITVADDIQNGTVTFGSDATSEKLTSLSTPAGDVLRIDAVPAEGYVVDQYLIDGEVVESEFFVVEGDHVISVTFKKEFVEPTTYAITVGAVSNGTVTVDKTEAEAGETVTVTATAAEGYELEAILVNGEAIVGNTFEVKGASEVTATFYKLFSTTGATVNLGDSLSLNFRFEPKDIEAMGGGYAVLNGPVGEQIVQYDDFVLSGNKYNVTYAGLAAKYMANEITATLYNEAGKVVSTTGVDSIQGYALRGLKQSTSDTLRTTLADMLVYGAAAQTYFNNRAGLPIGKLPTEGTAEEVALIQKWATEEHQDCVNKMTESHEANGLTVELESRILLNFTFPKSVVTQDMTARVTVEHYKASMGSETVIIDGSEFESKSNGTKWGMNVSALVVADARRMVRCEILDSEGQVVAWSEDSIESYTARALASSSSANYQWLKEMMDFCDSAYVHLSK